MKIRCQCNHVGEVPNHMLYLYDEVTERPFVNHVPNKCKCTNDIKLYDRNGRKLVFVFNL